MMICQRMTDYILWAMWTKTNQGMVTFMLLSLFKDHWCLIDLNFVGFLAVCFKLRNINSCKRSPLPTLFGICWMFPELLMNSTDICALLGLFPPIPLQPNLRFQFIPTRIALYFHLLHRFQDEYLPGGMHFFFTNISLFPENDPGATILEIPFTT